METSNKFRFTNSTIKNLPVPDKRIYYYDTYEVGLCLQITPNNNRSFYYRGYVGGKQLRIKIGEPSYMSVDEARQKISKVKFEISEGVNPIEERKKINQESTLKDMYKRFMEEKSPYIREVTKGYYEGLWTRYLSKLGKKKISQIKTEDMRALHRSLTLNHGYRCANQTIVLLRTIYNHFINQDVYQGSNPAIAVQLNKQESRTRHLNAKELAAFNEALNQTEDSIPKFAIMMMLFTGVRKHNILTMRWQDVDLENATWIIPETKTAHNVSVALVDVAVKLLKEMAKDRYNDYVFYSRHAEEGHITEFRKTWASLLKKANIKDFRPHDLRHTFATCLIANGADAFMVKKALTHRSLQSTQIYVNLDVDDLRDKLNETVNKMLNI